MKRFVYYILYLLVVWGAFRYFVRLPEVIEELWFKPLIWLVPVFWWNLSLLKPVLFFEGVSWKSIGLGVSLGLFYLILFGGSQIFNFDYFGVVIATSIVEEMVFSGFLTGYLTRFLNKNLVVLVIGVAVSLSRLPILFFVYRLNGLVILGVILMTFSTGVIHSWLRLRTDNILGSIVARAALGLVK